MLGLLYSHTLILSRSKQDRGGNTVFLPSKNTGFLSSPLVTDPDVSPSAGEGEEGQCLGHRRQRGRRPTAGRTVISGRALAREVLRSLHRCPSVGGSGLPPPTYPHPNDLQVNLPSKPPQLYFPSSLRRCMCIIFYLSAPLDRMVQRHIFFSSIVRGKATSWSRILYSLRPKILVIEMDVSRCILVLDTSILMTSNSGRREYLVQTRNKVGVGEFSMYIGLGTNRKERG